jgi:hypothetical protein
MDSRTVPAAYARWLRSVISVALREAQLDAAVRAGEVPAPPGFKPLPDTIIDCGEPGRAVVAVLVVPTEEQQLLDENWPTDVPAGAERFPGFRMLPMRGPLRVAEHNPLHSDSENDQ